jgi:transcription factor WhiB
VVLTLNLVVLGLDMSTSDDWKQLAACKGRSDVFLAGSGGHDSRTGRATHNKFDRMIVDQSKAVCATCPVEDDCLAWALAERIPYYVYGGHSWPERLKILQGKRRILVDTPDQAMLG